MIFKRILKTNSNNFLLYYVNVTVFWVTDASWFMIISITEPGFKYLNDDNCGRSKQEFHKFPICILGFLVIICFWCYFFQFKMVFQSIFVISSLFSRTWIDYHFSNAVSCSLTQTSITYYFPNGFHRMILVHFQRNKF